MCEGEHNEVRRGDTRANRQSYAVKSQTEDADRCSQLRWKYEIGSDRFIQGFAMIYTPPSEQEVMLYQVETASKPSFQRSYILYGLLLTANKRRTPSQTD